MHTRRLSLIGALLATVAMLAVLPLMWPRLQPADTNRMDARLRPARMRTLTVWLLSPDMEDKKLLSESCTAFERANEGVRVFLRAVTAQELTAANAVLPDAVLFATGDVPMPETVFVPLGQLHALTAGALPSGQSAGQSYAAPLWLSPNVLCVPSAWLSAPPRLTPAPTSFFELATPAPAALPPAVLSPDALPWRQLLAPGALLLPEGVALQQLMFLCPARLRGELAALSRPVRPTAAPAAVSDSLPVSRGAPSPTPPAEHARVRTLAAHTAAVKSGEVYEVCPMEPFVSDRVRYVSLCRDSDLSRAFVRFLLGRERQTAALSRGLMPCAVSEDATDPLAAAMLGRMRAGVSLPNAFAHTREELLSLCADGFSRAADPVETLLSLR